MVTWPWTNRTKANIHLEHKRTTTTTTTFNGLFSRTTLVSRHQKGKPFWILLEQAMMGWQWHQLDHMQIIRISLHTDNHASTSPLSFFKDRMPFLPPNQQRQSTEGNWTTNVLQHKIHIKNYSRCGHLLWPPAWKRNMLYSYSSSGPRGESYSWSLLWRWLHATSHWLSSPSVLQQNTRRKNTQV